MNPLTAAVFVGILVALEVFITQSLFIIARRFLITKSPGNTTKVECSWQLRLYTTNAETFLYMTNINAGYTHTLHVCVWSLYYEPNRLGKFSVLEAIDYSRKVHKDTTRVGNMLNKIGSIRTKRINPQILRRSWKSNKDVDWTFLMNLLVNI